MTIGVGSKQVLFDSSFAYESAPNITHATNEAGTKTLCGRACEDCVGQDADGFEPDCLTCNRVWRKKMGWAPRRSQISPTSRVS